MHQVSSLQKASSDQHGSRSMLSVSSGDQHGSGLIPTVLLREKFVGVMFCRLKRFDGLKFR